MLSKESDSLLTFTDEAEPISLRIHYTGWANKQRVTSRLSMSLPIIDRFSKFSHWHIL